ncbi:MAG: hypothetical protein ACRBCT_06640 [Alphaproteobacteria bacterium]
MSLKSMFQKINPGKVLGYGLAASGAIPAALDAFRMVGGDLSASASFAQNFGIVAAGFGVVQTSKPSMQPAPIKTPQVIIPRRPLYVMA